MAKKTPLRIGVIGCGAVARRYYLPAFKRHQAIIPHLLLVDIDANQAKLLAEDLGGGQLFTDYREIIAKVDGVIILLPHFLHAKVAGEFLTAGVDVLCEKPLTETGTEARILTRIAEQGGGTLCVNNTRRMFPSFQRVKEVIDSGILGTLQAITYQEGATFAWPSTTGFYVNPAATNKGVLLDIGAHVLDLICWWLGEKPKIVQFQDDSFGGPESVAELTLSNSNCCCKIFLNRLTDIDSFYRIEGSHGSIEGSLFSWNELTAETSKDGKRLLKLPPKVKAYPDFVLPIVDNFINVLQKKESPLISGNDVLPSIELLEECYQQRTRFQLPWYDIKESPNKKKGRVLVTGATGFIGARIVEHLCLSKEYAVRAGIRKWSSAARLGRFPVDIVLMDLLDRQQIEQGLEGITYVIHCAKGPDGMTEEGTRNLLDAALRKGIKRFVHLSTAEVYGNAEGEIREEAPFEYTGNLYNKSKIDAEKICWQSAGKGLPLTIIRPSIVYGPFSTNWTINFARFFSAKSWSLYEGHGTGMCNLIFVDDLVIAILMVLESDEATGQAFNINGPDMITWNEYFQKFNAMMGMPPLAELKASSATLRTMVMVPFRFFGKIVKNNFMGPTKKIAQNFAWVDHLMRQTETALKSIPCSDELKLFNKNAIYSSKKSRKLLKFVPQHDVDQGLINAVQWLKHQKNIQ